MAHRSAIVNCMVNAALKASRGLIRDFGEVEQLQVSKKGPADFVSTADTKAEKTVVKELLGDRPEFGFLLEEHGAIKGDVNIRWIVDPLDGTTNFLHGLPHFAISIAVEDRTRGKAGKGEITAAITYDPIKDEMFWAEKGRGAYLNDRRMRVSGRENLDAALLSTGIPFSGRPGHEEFSAELAALAPQVAGIRRFGAATLDLAYVAAGRYDGFWENNLQPWDIAAGILMVREAGGMVGETDGGDEMLETGSILATNSHLFDPVRLALREARKNLD